MQGHAYRNGQYCSTTPAPPRCSPAEDSRPLCWIDNEGIGLVVVFVVSLILWAIPASIVLYFVG